MERSLRIIASSLALLGGAALPARAQAPPLPAEPDDVLCETGVVENLTLDDAQLGRCRILWLSRIEEMRRRSKAHAARIVEENRLRRELEALLPPPPPPPVTIESFLGGGNLAYGDVVVTDKGPRVFIGRGEAAPMPGDFVALDSPLSPHRGNVAPYDGTFPGRRRLLPPAARKSAPKPREGQP